ncbi:MAG: HD family hydrolase [Candidatus Bathyarchaeia archaeon]|jgi:putative hydrolase of HD superfamily
MFLDFVSSLGKVKMIPRSGWISHGISLQEVESVADHSFSTTVLAMLLADLEVANGRRINIERVLRLALLHDLPEALTFDISKSYLEYLGMRGEAIKSELEQAAWKHLIEGIEKGAIRKRYAQLQSEFNAEQTIESMIVHAADRLDLLLQIAEYRRRGYPKAILADLWKSTSQKLRGSKLSSVKTLYKMVARLYKKDVS